MEKVNVFLKCSQLFLPQTLMFVEDTNFSEPEDPRDSSDQVESPSHRAASQQVALTSPGEESLERERGHLQAL